LAHFSQLLLFNEGHDMAHKVSRQYLGQRSCSIPGKYMWDLWLTTRTRNKLFSQYFSVLLVIFQQLTFFIYHLSTPTLHYF